MMYNNVTISLALPKKEKVPQLINSENMKVTFASKTIQFC